MPQPSDIPDTPMPLFSLEEWSMSVFNNFNQAEDLINQVNDEKTAALSYGQVGTAQAILAVAGQLSMLNKLAYALLAEEADMGSVSPVVEKVLQEAKPFLWPRGDE